MNGSPSNDGQAHLVILRSKDGRSDWQPVLPADVPEWTKRPEYMGRLVAGEMCMKCDEGPAGSDWYRAVPAREFAQMVEAQRKRARRAALRVVH